MSSLPTILIVDDNRLARQLLARRLGLELYRIEEAESGPEALAVLPSLRPDLVLLDVVMPELDGFEVCRRIRRDPDLRDLPVVLVTSLEDHDSLIKGIEAGADDFVSKSSDAAEIRARVKSIVQLNRYRRVLAERSRFEHVVRTSEDGFVLVDRKGRLHYANPAARRYLDLGTDQNLNGLDFLLLAHKRYRLEPSEEWADFPAADRRRWLVRPETQDVPALWLEVSILDPASDPGGVTATTETLVRLRDATSQMTQKRDIWRFQALVAHKLRTPLTVVMGSLDLLARDSGPPLEVPRVAKLALQSAKRLNDQILDILSFLSSPDLAQPGQGFLVGGLTTLAVELAAGLGVPAPSVDVPRDVADRRIVLGDAGFEVVLRELLDNARKFHPREEPSVEISVRWTTRPGEERIVLQVADDGSGIPSEQLGTIWTPYFQSERGFSGNVAGMGLGLSMVAAVVWSAGGDCAARNRSRGPGAAIELEIPLASTQEEEPTSEAQA